MGAFLPNHNDPIISILLLLGTIFVVSVLSYGYSIWKQERRQKELLGFIQSFDSSECALDTQSMEFEPSMKKPLFLLAVAYERSGEYSKAINLYLYLLKHTSDSSLLRHLAKSYQKAGFLQRAVDIYIEILSMTPRDKESLYRLEFIYEHLREFKRANEILEVLEAQGEDIDRLKEHLMLQNITKSHMQNDEKITKLVELINSSSSSWAPLRELFRVDAKLAWRHFSNKDYKKLVDILWKLESWQIDLDIIKEHREVAKMYYAKGYLAEDFLQKTADESSEFFAIDLIADARDSGNRLAEATFKYSCLKCKSSSPLSFFRCPNCHSVYSFNIEVLVEQKREKSSYSLQ